MNAPRLRRLGCWLAVVLMGGALVGCRTPPAESAKGRSGRLRETPSGERPPTSANGDDAAIGTDGAGGAHDPQAEVLDDSGETGDLVVAPDASATVAHPLDGWSDERIRAALKSNLASLGPMSVGSANAGSLINGVQALETRFFKPVSPSGSWGTQETLDYLARALSKVHEEFSDTPPLALGDISGKHGGLARPHLSHQSGRDVDIGYFYKDNARWYARGNAKNLDLPRTWAFVRALIAETDVDLILIDRTIQVLLERHALDIGEDPEWLSGVFRGASGRLRPIVRHAPGHATHIHIRFFNPLAQETGRRCFELLVEARLASPTQSYLSHRVKKNETLAMIAKKYGTSVAQLRAANRLKSSLIRAKSQLTIPVARRGPTRQLERLRIPERRVPPPRRSL